MRVMRPLRRAYRRHQSKLARRAALIAKLDHNVWHAGAAPASGAGSPPLSAWEEIFARPEWEQRRQTHRGRCFYCGARVSLRRADCGECGAVWDPKGGSVNWGGRVLFWLFATALSLAGGIIARDMFALAIADYCRPDCTGHINLDFVDFSQSYLLFLVATLLLVLATFIYEKSHIGQTGAWIPKI